MQRELINDVESSNDELLSDSHEPLAPLAPQARNRWRLAAILGAATLVSALVALSLVASLEKPTFKIRKAKHLPEGSILLKAEADPKQALKALEGLHDDPEAFEMILDGAIAQADADRSGGVSHDEFHAALTDLAKMLGIEPPSKAESHSVMKDLDKAEGSADELTKEELRPFVKCLLKDVVTIVKVQVFEMIVSTMRDMKKNLSEKDVTAAMKDADSNGDGRVEKNELKKAYMDALAMFGVDDFNPTTAELDAAWAKLDEDNSGHADASEFRPVMEHFCDHVAGHYTHMMAAEHAKGSACRGVVSAAS